MFLNWGIPQGHGVSSLKVLILTTDQDTIHKVLLALHRLQKVTKGTTPGSIQSIVS